MAVVGSMRHFKVGPRSKLVIQAALKGTIFVPDTWNVVVFLLEYANDISAVVTARSTEMFLNESVSEKNGFLKCNSTAEDKLVFVSI